MNLIKTNVKTATLLIFIFFSVTISINKTVANTITIALPSEGNPPYSYGPNMPTKGIYNEIFTELFAHTQYQPKFVFLSAARIRAKFALGEIDIECCPLPSWRKNEANISYYTNIILNTEDILVFPKDKKRKIETLKNIKVATIQGYGYLDDHVFKRLDVNSELTLLKLVEKKRVEVGIVDKFIGMHFKKAHALAVDLGVTHELAAPPIRVHHSKKHIIEELNQANKRLSQIIGHYIKDV